MSGVRAAGRARRLGAWCAAGAVLIAAAQARAYDEPAEAAAFDYYILSLSWSPTFCATHPDDHAQCGHRRGFVAHGLWPEYADGGGPEHCGGAGVLDPETVERAKSAMPDERLIHHEWVVHGSCTGLSPHDYFLTLIRAVGRLSFPSEFDGQAPRSLTAAQIVSAFEKANPSLTSRSIALHCRGAELEEVRICLLRDLHPALCGRNVHSRCRAGPLTIRAAR
jgi:ribonuclease T2